MRDNQVSGLKILLVLVLAVGASQGTAGADEASPSWQPPPPMPDDFDWVQMTSGEWLKGEIIAMYEESMEFDSDEFAMQTLDWEDIKEIRSAQIVQVAFDDVHHVPTFAVISHLVYVTDEQDVASVIVDGVVLMREREFLTLDVSRIKTEANALGAKIKAGLAARNDD